MTRAGLVLAVVAIAAPNGCGSTTPAERPCLVNQDCPADWFCDGAAAPNGTASCMVAPAGICRPIDFSRVGMACTDARDCAAAIFYCDASLHECALNVCLSFGNDPVVCDHGQCPDAGPIVECAPGCHAGTRNGPCRACFCGACDAADAAAGDGP